MLKVIQSPAKYLQGPDASVLFGQYAKDLADSFFVIADDFVMKLAGEKVLNGLNSHEIRCHAERFNGECSHGCGCRFPVFNVGRNHRRSRKGSAAQPVSADQKQLRLRQNGQIGRAHV